ncbi:DNA-binding response regulator [Vagococcus penaei]|uniref:DNA-binding response regulator n=1 Tax=Vagococcus penaei TaxID=633807 RepID=A0A1Q2D3N3_9ENTE|nr:response regulator transcription factor [Vagococcus penaei]AQP52990.1 DNA-binding response regulator [Vagococcus penaei]RSU02550.1 DNA-binding response regulator [Vagococcus penaei]
MKRMLVVDDEPSITTLLKYNLEKENFVVDIAYDGEEAVNAALSQVYDFIILDLMLPKLNGFDVIKRLRKEKINTPIIMLTAKDDTVDKIIGLEMGADDYLTKPFSPRELVARIRAVERRFEHLPKSTEQTDNDYKPIEIGELVAYPDAYRVLKNDEEIIFTKKEFELLIYFMQRVNRIIGRDELMQSIWKDDMYHLSRTVDIHVSHLREKIEVDPKKPKYIITVRGFGYKFQEPERHEK